MSETEPAQANLSASRQLARLVIGFPPDAMPQSIRHEAARSLLNYFGVALGGYFDPAGKQALTVLAQVAGPGEASVIGSDRRLDILSACFMNALNANALEFDDTHMPTIIHPTAPVAPPLFALAEQSRVLGTALLDAFVLGVEVACRAGNSVSPGHYARGWHITATAGVMGAAAASCRLLGYEAERTAHAIGVAASQAAGLVENLPTGAKNVQVGNSARNGLFAALLAGEGYTAAPQAIEGPRGWARAMGDVPDLSLLTGGLGESWELKKNAYKAYPCGIVLAPVIDACLQLRSEAGFAAGDVHEVLVRGHPLLLQRADRPHVPDDRISKLSIQHSAVIAFLFGKAGVEEFANIEDPQVIAFRKRVRAEADGTIPVEAATVIVTTRSGGRHEAHVTAARGSLERPLSDREIEAKVRELARIGGTGVDVEPLIGGVWQLHRSDNAGALMELAKPNGTR